MFSETPTIENHQKCFFCHNNFTPLIPILLIAKVRKNLQSTKKYRYSTTFYTYSFYYFIKIMCRANNPSVPPMLPQNHRWYEKE